MNEGFVIYLMARHRCTRERAIQRAEWIAKQNAERAKARKTKLESAQLLMPLDADSPGEEPADRFQVDDPTVNF